MIEKWLNNLFYYATFINALPAYLYKLNKVLLFLHLVPVKLRNYLFCIVYAINVKWFIYFRLINKIICRYQAAVAPSFKTFSKL